MNSSALHTATTGPGPISDSQELVFTSATNGARVPAALDYLLQMLEMLAFPDPERKSQAMHALVRFFQADAAGLYACDRPGQPMLLYASYCFPSSAPETIGNHGLVGSVIAARPMLQIHVVDNRFSPWYEAATQSEWQDIIVYNLPRCSARLVLAYTGAPKRLLNSMVKIVLRSLALIVQNHQMESERNFLRKETDELRHVLASGIDFVKEGVVLLDAQAGISRCNSLACQMLGYSEDEIVGLGAVDVLASEPPIDPLLQRVLNGESVGEGHQVTLFQRYGEPICVRMRFVPLRLRNSSTPHGVMILFVDRQAEPMEAVEKQLREENARLERMMSILAHEIRNPLAGIKAGLEFLEPALAADESASEDFQMIKGEIGRLDRLLHDALLVARSTEPRTQPLQITELIDELLTTRKKLMEERGVHLQKNYDAEIPFAPIDRVQMQQVFENLFVNAIHAMSDGGHLTIKIGRDSESSNENSFQRPMLQIQVCDTGPGISPEMQTRIFDPFFTTKKGGTGLGLAVARRIVGAHNGTLEVKSWPDVGTIFTVKLPFVESLNE